MLEFYQAYADYRDLMDLTEDLLRELCLEVLGTTRVVYQGNQYDFAAPFRRLTVLESILHFNPELSAAALEDAAAARRIAERLGIPCKDSWGLGKLQIEIFEKTVEAASTSPPSSPSIRPRCRRWRGATTPIPWSPTASNSSSAAANSPTAFRS